MHTCSSSIVRPGPRLQGQREGRGREPAVVPLERGRVRSARGRSQAQAAIVMHALQQLHDEVHGPAYCQRSELGQTESTDARPTERAGRCTLCTPYNVYTTQQAAAQVLAGS